jgi:GNAT superfamily N-acetyltransferase
VDELAAAVAFDRGLRVRAAERLIAVPGGVAVLHDRLRRLHHLNALLLDAPLKVEAEAIADTADRILGHLPHRHVVVDDAVAAADLEPQFRRAGWTCERIVYMVLRRPPDRQARAGLAVELSGTALRDLECRIGVEEERVKGWPPGAAAVVGAGMEALRRSTTSRTFAAGEDGELAALCTMFIDDGVAMLDNVGTLIAHRGRGLARAAISAAISAAQSAGCRDVLVAADADDWPQQLYERMGFDPLGTQVQLTLWATGEQDPT